MNAKGCRPMFQWLDTFFRRKPSALETVTEIDGKLSKEGVKLKWDLKWRNVIIKAGEEFSQLVREIKRGSRQLKIQDLLSAAATLRLAHHITNEQTQCSVINSALELFEAGHPDLTLIGGDHIEMVIYRLAYSEFTNSNVRKAAFRFLCTADSHLKLDRSYSEGAWLLFWFNFERNQYFMTANAEMQFAVERSKSKKSGKVDLLVELLGRSVVERSKLFAVEGSKKSLKFVNRDLLIELLERGERDDAKQRHSQWEFEESMKSERMRTGRCPCCGGKGLKFTRNRPPGAPDHGPTRCPECGGSGK